MNGNEFWFGGKGGRAFPSSVLGNMTDEDGEILSNATFTSAEIKIENSLQDILEIENMAFKLHIPIIESSSHANVCPVPSKRSFRSEAFRNIRMPSNRARVGISSTVRVSSN